jgi:hypothetical protein
VRSIVFQVKMGERGEIGESEDDYLSHGCLSQR